jgi:hypothetical protein
VGIRVEGTGHTVNFNSIRETTDDGIRLLNATGATVSDNDIGVDGSVGGGIAITPGATPSTGNQVGGDDAESANTFGAIPGDAILIEGADQSGNLIGTNLGGPAGDLFVDLEGTDGPGNGPGGPNDEVEAPKVKVGKKTITGTAEADGEVWVYRSTSAKGEFPAGLKKLLGRKDVKPDGTWKLNPAGTTIKKGWVVTALQNDPDGNGSELSKGKQRKN